MLFLSSPGLLFGLAMAFTVVLFIQLEITLLDYYCNFNLQIRSYKTIRLTIRRICRFAILLINTFYLYLSKLCCFFRIFDSMRLSRILFIILCCLTGPVFAQSAPGSSRLSVPIDFEVVNGDFSNAIVYMRREGETVASFKGAPGMKVKLEYNAEYRLDFTKPGYITKSIRINTGTPEDRRKIGFDPYKIGVRLFKQYEGVNIVVYNQPVAFIRFLPEFDEFGYDTDYTKSILSELRAAEDLLEKKAAEERRLEKMMTARKREERKSEAKVDAAPVKSAVKNAGPPVPESATAHPSLNVAVSENIPSGMIAGGGNGERQMAKGGFGAGGEDPLSSGGTAAGETPVGAYSGTNGDDVPKSGVNLTVAADPVPSVIETPVLEERSMQVVRENNRTVTFYFVRKGDQLHTFKMVQYDWGGLYYFVNETQTVSQHLFDALRNRESR